MTPRPNALHWIVAATISLGLHIGVAYFIAPSAPDRFDKTTLSGGQPVEMTALGNAFADRIVAGTITEEPRAALPREPAMVGETVGTIMAETPVKTLSTIQKPVTEVKNETAGRAAFRPVKPEMEIAAVADVPKPPYPRPRRHPVVKPREGHGVRRPSTPSAGSQGRDRRDETRGGDGWRRVGGLAAKDLGIVANGQDDAARLLNYQGEIRLRLQQALCYPRGARDRRLERQVTVRFTIARNGGVGDLRIIAGSGSALFDRAALEAVRRAAPFPAIPAAVHRSSLDFSVSVAFKPIVR